MAAILERWKVLPHGPLEEIDEGILTVAGEIKMPLGNFPRRMTVVGLSGNRTAIFSAIALNSAEMRKIEQLGTPSFLIVPSDMHRLDARIWKECYPDIRVVTPSGARMRVAEIVQVDSSDDILQDEAVRFQNVAGTGGHESALTVRRVHGVTLICNDIIGHVTHPHGLGAQVMARLMGFGVSEPQVPRIVRRKIVVDPKALASQFRDWAALRDLRRIIVSHGDPIETKPREVLIALAEKLEN
jgi:hypothetical protein